MHNQLYAVPSILPSSAYVYASQDPSNHYLPYDAHDSLFSPMVINPVDAIRNHAERVLSGDRRGMCSDVDKKAFEAWMKNEEYKKAIIEVCKSRLDLGWPYNYKSLDLMSVFSGAEIASLNDQIQKLSDSDNTVEGSTHLKQAAKPLLEKIKKEKEKQEEEEAKKRMAAVADMWGQLWSNQPTQSQLAAQHGGWAGWPYPWTQMPPGVAAQAGVEWQSKAPAGWTPWVVQPVPMGGFPVQGFPNIPRM